MKTKARKPAYAKASSLRAKGASAGGAAGRQENKKARKQRTKNAILCHPRASGDLFAQLECCVDEKIRPFIQMDGGEIELVELTKKNVLKVRLHGACCGCPAAGITLSYGVQAAIDEEFPEEDIQVLLVE